MLSLYTRLLGMWSGLKDRMRNEDGVLATEYVILLVLIALVIVGGATALGIAISSKLNHASSCVSSLTGTC
jgi:Flp pilus assembly pilin Flp